MKPDRRREKTHCKRGHEFTEQNTYRYKASNRVNPYRICRACTKIPKGKEEAPHRDPKSDWIDYLVSRS